MNYNIKQNLENELKNIGEKGLFRSLKTMDSPGGKIIHKNRKILNFSSNDYLNLSTNKEVKSASVKAIEKFGNGSTSSRLVSGHLTIHERVEKQIAELFERESCLIYGSGFLANLGVVSALADRNDEIYSDKLNHASLIDGSLMSRAKCHRFKHKNLIHLENLLKKSTATGKKIIISDSLFSMDGDIAPVENLVKIAKKNNAFLIIDEAHAIGVYGRSGTGISSMLERNNQPDVILGTFSKALGGYGGFAITSKLIRDYLINKSRSFIYSTGLPPGCLGGVESAFNIISKSGKLGAELLKKAGLLHRCLIEHGIKMEKFESHILPICIGDNKKTVALSEKLFNDFNILCVAIRPPTVPEGTSRLRLSVSLAHLNEDLEYTAEKIKLCMDSL
ncbi:MAG TPA: 8-amino-7-oxononanoate synthase [Victivallales bacterium]|nr:8-amino-7-oxononanoate synthase [Victivallales bacterium]